jgi:CHAT domain-containing protein
MRLTNLPTSGDEIQMANAAFPSDRNQLLMGTAATKEAFEREPLAEFRLLHLAVHGVSEEERPDRAALVLLEDRKAGVDGLLPAPEIAQLRLRADLVVLSACETATGRIQGQEGIETLSHAFVLAGARSVISTLWSIDDNFSLALIKRFYQHYRQTGRAADALSLAKRDMLAEYGRDVNPFYWAAFIFEGLPTGAVNTYDSDSKQKILSSVASADSNRSEYREVRPD